MLNDILDIVVSRIINKYPDTLKEKYPNTNFTTSDRVPQNPQFPTVYVHELASNELGQDLDGTTINAIRSTIRIEVTDNESMENVTEVMNNVLSTMKSMRYIAVMPEFQNDNSVYRKVATFRRVVGMNDIL